MDLVSLGSKKMSDRRPPASALPAGQPGAEESHIPCAFCLEPVKLGALVCRHCRNVLASIQQLAAAQASLEARLSALEATLTASTSIRLPGPVGTAAEEEAAGGMLPGRSHFHWPHMADNLFLGLSAMLAIHWLASTLPSGPLGLYRLAGLVVALPFGFRFEFYSESGIAMRVLAALAFGVLATACVVALDVLLGTNDASARTPDKHYALASVMAISLSHLTGSTSAAWWQRCAIRKEAAADARTTGALLTASHPTSPQEMKARFDALRAIVDAAPPVTAAAATTWAAIIRLLQ